MAAFHRKKLLISLRYDTWSHVDMVCLESRQDLRSQSSTAVTRCVLFATHFTLVWMIMIGWVCWAPGIDESVTSLSMLVPEYTLCRDSRLNHSPGHYVTGRSLEYKSVTQGRGNELEYRRWCMSASAIAASPETGAIWINYFLHSH